MVNKTKVEEAIQTLIKQSIRSQSFYEGTTTYILEDGVNLTTLTVPAEEINL